MRAPFAIARRRFLRNAAGAAAALPLAACGFKLRGAEGSYNIPFASIYIGLSDTSEIGTELKRNLRAGGRVVIADSAETADAVLSVVSENRNRQILSLNALGRAREYQLNYALTYTVRDRKGAVVIPPTAIVLRRNLAWDETQVLAKEAEANLLYRDMQGDAVQQILRQLAAAKPAA